MSGFVASQLRRVPRKEGAREHGGYEGASGLGQFRTAHSQIVGSEAFAVIVRLLMRGFDQNPILHT